MASQAQAPVSDTQSLAARVRLVVNFRDNGNAAHAAKRMGIPTATLDRILRGVVKNPRASVLERLAATNGVSIDWLLTGSGVPPTAVATEADSDRAQAMALWIAAVSDLRLPAPLNEAALVLPFTLDEFYSVIIEGLDSTPVESQRWLGEVRARNLLNFREVLKLAIEAKGVDNVRDRLVSTASSLILRFSPAAEVLLEQGKLLPEVVRNAAKQIPSPWELFSSPSIAHQKAAAQKVHQTVKESHRRPRKSANS